MSILKSLNETILQGIPGMLNWTYKWYHVDQGYSIEQVAAIFSDLILNGVKNNTAQT